MFKYEELDYNEIVNNPSIDPDSADAVYAMAQCFKLGKGVQVDENMYFNLLEEAAKLGNEAANRELSIEEEEIVEKKS